jgi:hypothetical protein
VCSHFVLFILGCGPVLRVSVTFVLKGQTASGSQELPIIYGIWKFITVITRVRSAHTAVFMCFVWISEQTAIISLYSVNWLVCITETECVYCAVRTGCCIIIPVLSEQWYWNMILAVSDVKQSYAFSSSAFERFDLNPRTTQFLIQCVLRPLSLGGKAAGVWGWLLFPVPNLIKNGALPPLPIWLRVLHRDRFSFRYLRIYELPDCHSCKSCIVNSRTTDDLEDLGVDGVWGCWWDSLSCV